MRLSRSQFGLSLPEALWASYVGTQAQVVWARQGDRDGQAEKDMRRFYEFVKGPTGGLTTGPRRPNWSAGGRSTASETATRTIRR